MERGSALDSCAINERDQSADMHGKPDSLFSLQKSDTGRVQSSYGSYNSRHNSGTAASTLGCSTAGVLSSVLVPVGEQASPDEKKDFLEKQLDSLRGQALVGNLKCMDGQGSRARGGVHHACRCFHQ